MFGAYGFGQGYFGQGPMVTEQHGEIAAPPLTMRRVTSQVARASNITGDTGKIRRKTSGTPSVRDIEGSH